MLHYNIHCILSTLELLTIYLISVLPSSKTTKALKTASNIRQKFHISIQQRTINMVVCGIFVNSMYLPLLYAVCRVSMLWTECTQIIKTDTI